MSRTWTVWLDEEVARDLDDLDRAVSERVWKFLRTRLAVLDDPRSIGKPPHGERFSGIWRYRVGDHRVLARIKDLDVVILVVAVGNRNRVYR
jgi:mRNA interferase RelE/StbE